MQIETLPVGPFDTNCYVVSNAAGEACVIDPGYSGERLLRQLREWGVQPLFVFLTHGHFDHIGGLPELVAQAGLPVVLSPADVRLYESPANEMPPVFPRVRNLPPTIPDLPATDFDAAVEVLDLPGHSPGGRALYLPADGVVFAGDVLFAGGVGRVDLPGGHGPTLLDSIREVLFALPDDTVVYPGHGPSTSIGREKRHNPFLRG